MKLATGFAIAVVALLLGGPASGGQDDGSRPAAFDARLSDPDAFGRYADRAARRSGAVDAPVWAEARPTAGRRDAPLLTPGSGRRLDKGVRVPSPVVAPESPRERPVRRRVPLGVAVGLTAVAAGLSMLASSGRVPEQPTAPVPPTRTSRRAARERSPIRRHRAPEPHRPPPRVEDSRPRTPETWREGARDPRLSFWAISAAEKAAIERWDRSVEKEFGMLALDEWLDAHASEPKDFDPALLKAKLRRDA